MLSQKKWVQDNIKRDPDAGIQKINYPLAASIILVDFEIEFVMVKRPTIIIKYEIEMNYVRIWIGVNDRKLLSVFSTYYNKSYPADEVIISNV